MSGRHTISRLCAMVGAACMTHRSRALSSLTTPSPYSRSFAAIVVAVVASDTSLILIRRMMRRLSCWLTLSSGRRSSRPRSLRHRRSLRAAAVALSVGRVAVRVSLKTDGGEKNVPQAQRRAPARSPAAELCPTPSTAQGRSALPSRGSLPLALLARLIAVDGRQESLLSLSEHGRRG